MTVSRLAHRQTHHPSSFPQPFSIILVSLIPDPLNSHLIMALSMSYCLKMEATGFGTHEWSTSLSFANCDSLYDLLLDLSHLSSRLNLLVIQSCSAFGIFAWIQPLSVFHCHYQAS